MEYCNTCGLYYKKVFKSSHNKSVKHQEKLGQYYCNSCNLYLNISDESSHLNSDEHKNKNKKVWCEECGKYITDKTRHFHNEIHLQNRQQNGTALLPSSTALLPSGNGVNIIMSENTYIKLKVNPTENLEHNINELLSKTYFPRYKYQLSYLAKFSKIVNGEEEVFKRWIKSDLIYNNSTQQEIHKN